MNAAGATVGFGLGFSIRARCHRRFGLLLKGIVEQRYSLCDSLTQVHYSESV
jgi:hypothetical protein